MKDLSVGFLHQCFLLSFPWRHPHEVLLLAWHAGCWPRQVSPRQPPSQHNTACLLLRGTRRLAHTTAQRRIFYWEPLEEEHLRIRWADLQTSTTDNKMNFLFLFLLSHPPYCCRCKISGNNWCLLPQNGSNWHAVKWKNKNKNKNNPRVIIKFSVLFKILVLILKKEVHFLFFLVLASGYNQVSVFFSPVFSILHKRPETTGLSKSCRQGGQRFCSWWSDGPRAVLSQSALSQVDLR